MKPGGISIIPSTYPISSSLPKRDFHRMFYCKHVNEGIEGRRVEEGSVTMGKE